MEETQERTFEVFDTTPEEADKIAAGDTAARNAFILRNMEKMRKYCRNAAAKMNNAIGLNKYNGDDLFSQLCVDLPALDWTNGARLAITMKQRSFFWAPYGGYTQRKEQGLQVTTLPWSRAYRGSEWWYRQDDSVSVDAPITEDLVMGDTLTDGTTPADELEAAGTPDGQTIADALRDCLTDREYTALIVYLDGGSTANEHRTEARKVIDGNLYRAFEKFGLHWDDVRARLTALGVDVPEGYNNAAKVEEMVKRWNAIREKRLAKQRETASRYAAAHRAYYQKTAEIQRAKSRERMRAKRAAERAQRGAATI